MILSVIFIPQAIINYYATDILLYLGQPEESAYYAGIFTRIMIPGLWFFSQSELLLRFLTAQGVLHIVVNAQILT